MPGNCFLKENSNRRMTQRNEKRALELWLLESCSCTSRLREAQHMTRRGRLLSPPRSLKTIAGAAAQCVNVALDSWRDSVVVCVVVRKSGLSFFRFQKLVLKVFGTECLASTSRLLLTQTGAWPPRAWLRRDGRRPDDPGNQYRSDASTRYLCGRSAGTRHLDELRRPLLC